MKRNGKSRRTMLKLRRKDFLVFKKECIRLQRVWALDGWTIFFSMRDLKLDVYATTYRVLVARQCTIELNEAWDDSVRAFSRLELKLVAKHEMLHVLVGRLGIVAGARFVTHSEFEEAEHELIAHLEKLVI